MNSVSRHTLSVSDSVYEERAQSFLGVGSVQPPPDSPFFQSRAWNRVDSAAMQFLPTISMIFNLKFS